MSSRALRKPISPRRASQRRARNGWFVLFSVICLMMLIEVTAHLISAPRNVTTHAHNALTAAVPQRIPLGCATPAPQAQQQAAAALPDAIAFPNDMVPVRVVQDADGTLIVLCTATLPQPSHDTLQHAMLAHGWQLASDITAESARSATYLHDSVVIFVTIVAQPTSPPTTQVIVTVPR